MTITSGFFKSVNGDRKYQAEFFASYFASFIGNGIYANPSTNLQVLAYQNMQTRVSVGRAWINGSYLRNDEAITITHAPADGVMRRVDRIVVGLNLDSRAMDIYLKPGTPGTNAVAPALVRNATVYELALADVAIIPGNTSISQANITDQRLNSDLCGIVAGVVQQLDTSTAFAQYEQQFNDFLEGVQDALDGDTAGNLYNMIVALQNKTNYATLAQAQAGTSNSVVMTPLRTKDYVNTLGLGGVTSQAISSGSYDDLINGGIFSVAGSVANGPSNIQSILFVMPRNNSSATQIAVTLSDNAMYNRSKIGSVWSAWRRVTENLSLLTTTDKSSYVAAINEVKLQANNINGRWASVVGAPLLSTDNPTQLETKTQTIKSKLATYNTNKGQASNNSETLDALVEKVNLIQTQSPVVSGTVVSSSNTANNFNSMDGNVIQYSRVIVSGLTFQPRRIILFANVAGNYYETSYDVERNSLLGVTCSSFRSGDTTSTNSNIRPNEASAYINATGFSLPATTPNTTYTWKVIG